MDYQHIRSGASWGGAGREMIVCLSHQALGQVVFRCSSVSLARNHDQGQVKYVLTS